MPHLFAPIVAHFDNFDGGPSGYVYSVVGANDETVIILLGTALPELVRGSTVTVTGDETAVNTYMANFGYTPNTGYINANATGGALASGALAPDVLSLSVTNANNIARPVTGSLNLVVRAADNKPRIVSPLPDRMYYAEPGVATETAITLTLADADYPAALLQTEDPPLLLYAMGASLATGGPLTWPQAIAGGCR